MRSMKIMPGSPPAQAAVGDAGSWCLCGIDMSRDLVGSWIDQIYLAALPRRVHELIGSGHRDVEVLQETRLLLGLDELQNVGVIDAKGGHVRAPAASTLLDHIRGRVEYAHEGYGAGGHPPVARTTSFLGRSREKEKPVPPPLWWMRAMFFRASKMPGRESSTGRTKHAESCPSGRPAFMSVGELGRNSRLLIIFKNLLRQIFASPPYLISARET